MNAASAMTDARQSCDTRHGGPFMVALVREAREG